MVGYDDENNALTLGDDDSIAVGDYELKYSSTDDEWQAEYGRPVGGEIGRHGEITNAEYTENSRTGKRALDVSRENSRVVVPKGIFPENVGDFSISLFINTSSSESGLVLEQRNDNFAGMFVEFGFEGSGVVGFGVQDNNQNVIKAVSSDLSDGNWHHVVGTYDSSEGKIELYVDGSSVDTVTDSEVSSVTLFKPDGAIIAQQQSGDVFRRDFLGIVDDVRSYNDILTPSEVTALSNQNDVSSGLIAHYEFEFPETPNIAIDSTGDIFPKNAIPRSTSGSLVPEGFADVLSNGEVLADNGEIYASVQDAVNAASGFVFVGPGTFNENVTIDTAGLTLLGSGRATVISGPDTGTDVVTVSSSNVTIRNLAVRSTAGAGNNTNCVSSQSGANHTFENIDILESDDRGFNLFADDISVINCTITNTDDFGLVVGSGQVNLIVNSCIFDTCGGDDANGSLSVTSDDSVVSNNIIRDSLSNGIRLDGNDNTVGANRIINSQGGNGIATNGNDNVIYNNRISDSSIADLGQFGSGNTYDSNLTGASN